MSENIITIKNLHKTYERPVLSGVDLTIREGETLVILGGSGSGKSQILKHIIGLIKADSDKSEVWVDGHNITVCSKKELVQVRKKMGLVFQAGALFDSMTIYENMAFPLRENFHFSEDEIYNRVIEMLHLVDLGQDRNNNNHISHSFLKKMPNELSGGMQKRLALARTVAMKPKILMYDEPTTGLDPVTSRTIGDLINKTKKQEKVTSIVVTHDMPLAENIADEIAFLHEGKIRFIGTKTEFANSTVPEIKKFIETSKENITRKEQISEEQKNNTFDINILKKKNDIQEEKIVNMRDNYNEH